jgi:phenylglyoxylate dehydrogenase epsilon subunit
MPLSKYLIVGSSHAGLSALEAIRVRDTEGSITLVSREETSPYSPTILPYVVSGQIDPERIFLRDEETLDRLGVRFRRGENVTAVDAATHTVTLATGKTLEYEKLLLATGAAPSLPSVEGLGEVSYHVLRTLEDALRLRSAMEQNGSAIVLGAGLIGMHAAENLARGGIRVTVVEALPQVLPGYFDDQAAGLIQQVFTKEGIKIITGRAVKQVSVNGGAFVASLDSGEELSADLLLVSTGVQPRVGYLSGSGVALDRGILVDERMKTSAGGIWAAGDVAQAHGFFDSERRLNATLPDAVEQGRIAGMAMVDDPALKPYSGGIARNTYKFFGHRAFSVGMITAPSAEGIEVTKEFLPADVRYQKLLFQDDRLVGASGINSDLDPGIMCQLIRRRVDLGEVKERFADAPLETGRILMSRIWR